MVSHEGKHLKIALPESESAAREGLMRAPTRKFLEETAQKLLGRALMLDVVLDASLKLPEPVQVAVPKPPEPEPDAPAKKKPNDTDDELIRATVEKFKATLLAS